MRQLVLAISLCITATAATAQSAEEYFGSMEPKIIKCGIFRGQRFTTYFRIRNGRLEFNGVSPQIQDTPTTYSVPLSDKIRIDPAFVDNRLSVEFYCTDRSRCMSRKEGGGPLENTDRVKLVLMPEQQTGSCSRAELDELRRLFVSLGN